MAKRPRKSGNPELAVAYIRLSTDRERQELGAEAQRASIEAWATRNAVTIVAWHIEEVSGGAPLDKRPVLLEAIAALGEHNAARLVVHRLDRFSRDPLSAALAEVELRRHGAALAVSEGGGEGDDPTAELVRGILLSVARFERAMTKARIKAALGVKKRRGLRAGEIPFGFQLESPVSHNLIRCPTETKTIQRIVGLSNAGESQRAIAAILRAEGVTGRTGRPLSQTQVARILRKADNERAAA